jgi:murein DD-endopeptidase / murein LD-carboxypeptidase
VPADAGGRIAAQAIELLGVPFRFRGRRADSGLDCIGAVVEALSRADICLDVPGDYTLRGDFRARIDAFFDRSDFVAIEPGAFSAGDIVLCEAGPRQLHFGVITRSGLVHAHAGLGRVVLTPLPLPWGIAACWRYLGD